jgi:xanthine dehydrogenase YagS FAD-binding subunit
MNRFDYVRPATVSEAVAAAAAPGSAYLAAGTNLIDLMKGGIVSPQRLVDVSRLPGLDRIEPLPDGGVRIGARVRNADLAHDPTVSKRFPAVAEALLAGASAQLRNAATVGGNLLQRTRCAYFYDPASACNKRQPGAGCDARGGENRLHAVLGWSESCIATHPSDFCVPLAALNAVVEIEGQAGRRREVALEEFHLLPGTTPERESVLAPGELVVAVRLPGAAARFAAHARYLKLRERTSSPSPWSPPPPACRSRKASLPRRGWRWAAWRPSHGVPEPRRRRWPAPARIRSAFAALRRWRWQKHARLATTPSRSSSLGGSWCAR